MSFWDKTFIPQKKTTWRIIFGGDSQDVVYQAKSVTLPKYGSQVFEDLVGKKIRKSLGAVTWQPITVVIADIVELWGNKTTINNYSESTAMSVFLSMIETEMSSPSGYQKPSTEDRAFYDFSYVKIQKIYASVHNTPGDHGEEVIKAYTAMENKPSNPAVLQVVEEWELIRPKLESVDFGDLNYSSDEHNEISITIQYDECKYDTTEISYKPDDG